MPFPRNHFREGGAQVDGDLPEAHGFSSQERRSDPPDSRPSTPKLHVFEFCCPGEVKRRHNPVRPWSKCSGKVLITTQVEGNLLR